MSLNTNALPSGLWPEDPAHGREVLEEVELQVALAALAELPQLHPAAREERFGEGEKRRDPWIVLETHWPLQTTPDNAINTLSEYSVLFQCKHPRNMYKTALTELQQLQSEVHTDCFKEDEKRWDA